MNNVRELKPVEPFPFDETLVPTLEMLVEEAKAGRIAALSIAMVTSDGGIRTLMSPPHQHVFTMLGAIERLKIRFHNLHVDEPEA